MRCMFQQYYILNKAFHILIEYYMLYLLYYMNQLDQFLMLHIHGLSYKDL